MAVSVFHPFPRLPVELRLRIWEAACAGSTDSHRNLQYIDVRNGEGVPIPCNWPKAPGQMSTTKINRSAYLIDGGLWRACKESREVIAKCTHLEEWIKKHKQAIVDFGYYYDLSADRSERLKCLEKYNPNRSGGNESPHPATIDTCEGEEECRMLAYPFNDLFCIQVEDWIDIRHVSHPTIYMSLNRNRRNDHEDDHEDDYESDDEDCFVEPTIQELRLKNFALEFDSSWLMDLPDHIYWLSDENSARGYLAYLLKEKAGYLSFDFDIEREGIWLIDKEAEWFNDADKHHDTVYRDCDGEFITA
ncbi:hypothetical protein ACLX1H_003376 [Fusarium chlamydosporum]